MPRLDRYQDPVLCDMLAVEYVLGIMNRRVRKRFQRLLGQRDSVRRVTEAWEQRLGPLAEQIQEVLPSERVWRDIQREIDFDPQTTQPQYQTGFWCNLFLWRTTAFAALTLAGALFVYQWVILRPQINMMPSYVAILESKHHVPMFVAAASHQPSQLIIRVADKSSMSSGKDLELWCVMKGSGKPMSMGVLKREQETVFRLNDYDLRMMNETSRLEISAEPMGGSPTGKPTGPIMYKGMFVSLI